MQSLRDPWLRSGTTTSASIGRSPDMCGFAGFWTSPLMPKEDLTRHAERMTAPITHRGPDDAGVWVDEQAGVAFGFRRLAIVDLSPHGHQPMHSASGRFVVLFNGEVYNFRDLRHELEQHGHQFRGGSDTEVVLAAFEQWGIRPALTRFIGMFAIAIWDTALRQLSLVRDRLGKKPLYVYAEPGLLSFGSELKALVAGPSFDSTIDHDALASYLRYLYVPAPKCIFRRAMKVMAGHILTIRSADAPLSPSDPYWSLTSVARAGLGNPVSSSEQETVEDLEALLGEAVRCRMHADVPIGALLSGGVDSSLVAALMQQASTRPIKTYTIGFSEGAFDEAHHAARVAAHLGTDHTEVCLTGEDARSLVPTLPDIFDEPLADPSQLPTLLVSQLARKEVTVALSGDGGDELFGGYNRYVYGVRVLARVNRIPRQVRRCVAAGIGGMPPSAWNRFNRAATVLMPGVSAGRVHERAQKVGNLMMAATEAGMYRSLLSAWQEPQRLVPGCTRGEHPGDILAGDEPSHLLDRMMLADQIAYLADDLLAKLDRASMSVSLEVRAPLLDHRVAELSWRLPRDLKLRGSVGKWILRQVLYRHVPRELVERPKMGFSVPIDRWLRGPLRAWADGLLSRNELARDGIINPDPVIAAWNSLKNEGHAMGSGLWAVIMFQAWRLRWQV